MKPGTVDKMIARWDSLDHHELQSLFLRLVEQKGVFQQVFEAMREGVVLFDTDGRVTYANRAAGGIFGMESKDMQGEGFSKSVFGIAWGDITQRIGPVTQDMEISYPERRLLNFYLMPLESGNLEILPVGYVLIVRDITDQQQQTNEQIESEKLNALTLLAAGVAHEIGNPLNSLGLHLQLLERKLRKLPQSESEECLNYVKVANAEMKRLDIILKQFLHAIRPTRPQREPCNLNELIAETLDLLAPELSERNIMVISNYEKDLPSLELDQVQIKQVFYNLIKNAYQAIPSNGGSIALRTFMTDADVCATVEDTGTGISPEMMGILFEPFQTTKSSGNGLGLLIVRRILREHGGSLRIESEKGMGTRMTVQLPRGERPVRLLGMSEKGGGLV